ncbi:MAG: 5'-nucleotidase C-terminal domain-containing protein [Desulfomonile tiedjei]|nr:5'-nucleotidase C-terminal domain-containing protein [Desulfomonile tiedjei]
MSRWKIEPAARSVRLSLLVCFLSLWFASGSGIAAESLKLTILHMNDPHAHYVPYKDKEATGLIGGFAKARTVMSGIEAANRADGRETLKFLSGDLLMGTPYSTMFKGRLGLELLEKMQFTAMTVGNHEFDYGADHLLRVLKPLAKVPLLSANIRSASGEELFQRSVEMRFPGSSTRVLIFGLTTAETPQTTHPGNVNGIAFQDSIQTARELLTDAKQEDLVIAVTHLGLYEDKRLAAACPLIDVIVGGHSHTELKDPIEVGGTIVCQAGAYAKFVGRLDLDVTDGKVAGYQGRLIRLDPDVPEDSEIASLIADHTALLDNEFKQVIGSTEVFLDGNCRVANPGTNTNLGLLITSTMAAGQQADVAVLNGGSVRASIPAGNITPADVYTALPFGGSMVKLGLTGEDLLSALERGANLPNGSGGRLQTYGVSYTAENGRVTADYVRGEPFDPKKTYVVITNDFLAAGGDGYSMFRDKARVLDQSAVPVSDLMIGYLKDVKVITKELLENIQKKTTPVKN